MPSVDDLYRLDGGHIWYTPERYLESGVGNNAFSLNKKPERPPLRITPLTRGPLSAAQVSDKTAFQDFDGSVWMDCPGLESALLCTEYAIPIYLFDNHNHAFYGWCEGLKLGWFRKGATLVHMDAHYDDALPPHTEVEITDLESVWKYTNETLQIATFIQPALSKGLFVQVLNAVESREFEPRPVDGEVVMDLDLDVFCDEMNHVSWAQKRDLLRYYLPQTKLITMATSPFFIEQEKALVAARRLVQELFSQS